MTIWVGTTGADVFPGTTGLTNSGNDVLRGDGGDDTIFGGTGDDLIIGGLDSSLTASGSDFLFGEAGNDRLIGDDGDDVIDGGADTDEADYSKATQAVTINLVTGIASAGSYGTDTLIGIEGLRGSAFGDDMTGDGNDNFFRGFAGNDTIDGGLGIDWVYYDRDITVGGASGIVVDLSSGAATDGFGNSDTLISIENVSGTETDDSLTGDSGANILEGLGGNDTLNGGAGADVLDGGAGIDTVSYQGSAGSLRVDLMFSHINTNVAAGDTYVSIENLIGSQGFDNLRGTLSDNLIQGMSNVDYIFGRQGNDTLEGGVGDDVLFGGPGTDVLDGGANRDRAQYSESLTALVLDLMNPNLNTGEAAGDVYISIEDLAGGKFADSIAGDLGDNRLFGREGADMLYGRAGNDYLNGGANGDRLDGGAGDDTLRGGTHADTFVFDLGADVVEDFNFAHADQIAIDKSLLGGTVLTGADIVATYASVIGGEVVFDFGSGNTLTIESLSSLAGLDGNVLSF